MATFNVLEDLSDDNCTMRKHSYHRATFANQPRANCVNCKPVYLFQVARVVMKMLTVLKKSRLSIPQQGKRPVERMKMRTMVFKTCVLIIS